MAKLTFTLTAAVGTVAVDSPALTDAEMKRFTDWLWSAYPQLNADETPKPKTNANLAQAFRDYSAALWRGTKANVMSWERSEAAKAASDAVTELPN